MLKILVVDDDDTLRLTMRTALECRGYQIEEARDGIHAIAMCRSNGPFDAVFLDVNMPNMNGLTALSRIKEFNPKTICIILTAYSNVKEAVAAIKEGAFDYLEKPVDADRILAIMDSAIEANSMVEVAANSAPQLHFDPRKSMIGESTSIRKVFDLIYKLSKVETSVLIRGESGTGKELVAQALHYNSHRKKGPFVAVNCGAMPETLIESELFGHEKGAFTGADRRKIGKFQYAAGGTIFLDEIGDISLPMQVKLLRVLQEKRFTPVGSNQEIETDVRIISATNKNLEKLIETEKFRADLFYRINVLPIHLPPLRERREDIKQLVEYMISKFNHIHRKNIKTIDKDSLNALRLYNWPGNIRELENVIEHAFIMETESKIHLESLPHYIQKALTSFHSSDALEDDEEYDADRYVTAPAHVGRDTEESTMLSDFTDLKYPILKERFEKEFILRALQAFGGRINQTAEHTQMTKVTLLRKLEKYGINPRDFR
jgi:DNA-binding NtrC family response regulator